LQALEQSRGKIYGRDGAAEILGMKPTTLTSRNEEHETRSVQELNPKDGDGQEERRE